MTNEKEVIAEKDREIARLEDSVEDKIMLGKSRIAYLEAEIKLWQDSSEGHRKRAIDLAKQVKELEGQLSNSKIQTFPKDFSKRKSDYLKFLQNNQK